MHVAVLKTKISTETEEVRELRHKIELYSHEMRELERELATLAHAETERAREEELFSAEVREAVALVQSRALQYVKYAILSDGRELTDEELAAQSRSEQLERKRQLERLKIRLEELGGVNEEVLREYKNAKERDDFLEKELADLATSAETLARIIAELTQELTLKFTEGLQQIDEAFNKFFGRMFVGGTAHVVRTWVVRPSKALVVSEGDEDAPEDIPEPTDENEEDSDQEIGVEIDVRLPNKRVRGLDMLSGGERALTSIALIFAMSQINPPPFIILDETDAALDEANSRRYGDALEILAEKSQLILITHNRETMSRAGILYGITMGADGCSRLLSIKLEDALAVAK